jgi:hypothetical protein
MKQDVVVRSWRRLRDVLLVVVIAGWFALAGTSAWAAADSGSCSASAGSRQMDFWIGDWTVTYPGMPGSAASKVSLVLDDCVLIESWEGGEGHKGENIFAYSADDKSWHGMFADNQGRVHMLEGKVAPGAAEFTGPSRGPNGQAVLNRIKVVRVTANTVEQSWEKSRDNGVTWTTEFRGQYTRHNP